VAHCGTPWAGRLAGFYYKKELAGQRSDRYTRAQRMSRHPPTTIRNPYRIGRQTAAKLTEANSWES
jgi:hypothetical protein